LRKLLLDEEIYGNMTEANIAEAKYVLFRKLGIQQSNTRVNSLLKSGYIPLHGIHELIHRVAEYKCRRALSIMYCFTLALANYMNAPALFARREKEIVEEMRKRSLDVDVIFLEDYV